MNIPSIFKRKKNKDLIVPRKDARKFVLNGDNVWGDSITYAFNNEGLDDNHRRVMGWQPHLPVRGDIIYLKMTSGKWGTWIFQNVERCSNPTDMFFADIVGAIDYADERGDNPTGSRGSEIYGKSTEFVW